MRKRIWMLRLACLLGLLVLAGCTASKTDPEESAGTAKDAYEQITPAQAKELMDNEVNVIVLDVRTEEEYHAGHIEGAVLIPDYETGEKAAHSRLLPERPKKQKCRRRACGTRLHEYQRIRRDP